MLTLIENGELYAPEPGGRVSILLLDEKLRRSATLTGAQSKRSDSSLM
jgi:hypothetical protein